MTANLDQLLKTKWWRSIIEMSTMINNDEYIFYTRKEIKQDEVAEHFTSGLLSKPRLVISRPVFRGEVIPEKKGYSVWKAPKLPKETHILDSLFRIKDNLIFLITKAKIEPSKAVAHILGTEYYDCMSGGCPTYMLALLKTIVEKYKLNLDEDVYPGEDPSGDWVTLKDFVDNNKDLPDMRDVLGQFPKLLPLCQGPRPQ